MKNLYSFIFALLISFPAICQESIYFANGSRFNFKLLEADANVLQIGELKTGQLVKRSLPRENILMTFNAKGNYLLVSDLKPDPSLSSKQLIDFYGSGGAKNDILIMASPVQVIECTISYKSDEIVNYVTPQGAAGSANQRDIALIIMRDGQHEFSIPPAEAAPKLAEVKAKIDAIINGSITQVSEKPKIERIAEKEERSAITEDMTPNPIKNMPEQNKQSLAKKPEPETFSDPVPDKKPGLSQEEVSEYSRKGVKKVDEFVQYLNIISDKNTDPEKKDEAIDQALKLFLKDATIEVSSANRSGKRKYLVKDYLTRLKLLPYGSTQISWNEVNYVKDLALASDGKYYGIITGSQTFTGYSATNADEVIYSDVTEKMVKVQLQSYEKSVEGQQTLNWEILLGNVGVNQK